MIEPKLYIVMRTDMESMTPGKGMAQAAHAANVFTTEMDKIIAGQQHPEYIAVYKKWRGSFGFGTTIVLDGGTHSRMCAIVNDAAAYGFPAGIVHDPGYPVKDGETFHKIPVDTCGYVFLHKETTNRDLRVLSAELHH